MWFAPGWFATGWFAEEWWGGGVLTPSPKRRYTTFYSRIEWLPKLAGETRIYEFDATPWYDKGMIPLTMDVSAFAYMGTDEFAQDIVDGGATLKGTMIQQMITGGVVGAIYDVECTVTFTDGQIRQQRAFLAVTKDLN